MKYQFVEPGDQESFCGKAFEVHVYPAPFLNVFEIGDKTIHSCGGVYEKVFNGFPICPYACVAGDVDDFECLHTKRVTSGGV